jgi:predicted ATPase
LERVVAQQFYRPEAFFIRGLGFIEPSAARRISFEDAIRFERVHEQVYRDFGFQLVWLNRELRWIGRTGSKPSCVNK